jgi:curved DNA-binding protein CbpA
VVTESDQRRLPRNVEGYDLRALPLTPTDAYLLSRIDGTLTEQDLVTVTGLTSEDVARSLDHLAELGVVTWDGGPQRVRAAEREQNRLLEQAMRRLQGPVVERFAPSWIPPPDEEPSKALYDPAELDEDIELPPEKRRRILDVFYRLDDMDHYELLGVDHEASKKDVKEAYYRLAAEYHPDRHFRKRLGSFKQKMELVFARVTIAHDTLTRKQTREEYDAYLGSRKATRRIERSLQQGGPAIGRDAGPASSQTAAAPASNGSVADARGAPLAPQDAKASDPPRATVATASGRPAESDRARRDAFAAKLSGGRVSRFPPAQGSRPPAPQQPVPSTEATAQQAAESLRRQMMARRDEARRAQLKKFLDAAEEAKANGDAAAAANAYRLARNFAPDDELLREQCEVAELEASRALADEYLRLAQYEERAERWREAARSYTRAADGMAHDAGVQQRAAEMMLRAGADLHAAAEYAKRAIARDPKNARFHCTLGEIYMAAGLGLSARRELELAAEYAPEDTRIAKLLAAAKKT